MIAIVKVKKMGVKQTALHREFDRLSQELSKGIFDLLNERKPSVEELELLIRARLLPLESKVDDEDALIFFVEGSNELIKSEQSDLGEAESHVWLTTQQAARLLNVSRTHLISLIKQGKIPFSETEGGHRRLLKQDVLSYKESMRKSQEAGFDAMISASEDLDLY